MEGKRNGAVPKQSNHRHQQRRVHILRHRAQPPEGRRPTSRQKFLKSSALRHQGVGDQGRSACQPCTLAVHGAR